MRPVVVPFILVAVTMALLIVFFGYRGNKFRSTSALQLLSVRMHTALVPWDDCASSAAAIDLSMGQADTSKWRRSG